MTTIHRITTTVVLVLSLTAAAGPAASARPVDPEGTSAAKPATAVYDRQDRTMVPLDQPKVSIPHQAVRVQTTKSGVDWGDIGIAAGGGIALCVIGLGGALGVSQHRARRTRRTTVLTS